MAKRKTKPKVQERWEAAVLAPPEDFVEEKAPKRQKNNKKSKPLKIHLPATRKTKPNSPEPQLDSPEPHIDYLESDPITPPPLMDPTTLKKAVTTYLRTRGHSVDGTDDSDSEMELLMQERRRTFQDGIGEESQDSDDESMRRSVAGEDEDELSPIDEEDELESDEEKEPTPPPVLKRKAGRPRKNDDAESAPIKKKDAPFDLKCHVCCSHATQLAELFNAAPKVQATSKSKKDFFVELKDLTVASKPSGKTKADDKKKQKSKQKRESDSDEDSDAGSDGKQILVDGKKLEADNTCAQHSGHGCIKYINGHVQLSKNELSTWAVLLRNGYASTTTLPPALKIDVKKPEATPKAPAAPPAIPPPMNPYGMWPFMHPTMPMPYQTPAPRTQYNQMPSSDPTEEFEDTTLFPRINNSVSELKELIPEIAQGTVTKLLLYAGQDVKAIRRKEKKRARRDNNHHFT
ncbi:hypothetical protein C8R43DRAFT_940696 [Mycena crocata]|nr:hypothetical protein C8R43DRAFT_940696 [Mycena crocata]